MKVLLGIVVTIALLLFVFSLATLVGAVPGDKSEAIHWATETGIFLLVVVIVLLEETR
jgi:hypothetical protein